MRDYLDKGKDYFAPDSGMPPVVQKEEAKKEPSATN